MQSLILDLPSGLFDIIVLLDWKIGYFAIYFMEQNSSISVNIWVESPLWIAGHVALYECKTFIIVILQMIILIVAVDQSLYHLFFL